MTIPELGFSKPIINLARVDFPDPDSPTIPIVSPFLRIRDASFTAVIIGGDLKIILRGNLYDLSTA